MALWPCRRHRAVRHRRRASETRRVREAAHILRCSARPRDHDGHGRCRSYRHDRSRGFHRRHAAGLACPAHPSSRPDRRQVVIPLAGRASSHAARRSDRRPDQWISVVVVALCGTLAKRLFPDRLYPTYLCVRLTYPSTSEALGVAFMIGVGSIMGLNVLILPITGSPLGPTSNTGLAWIPLTFRFAIYFVAALVILALQYFRRATRTSWLILAASVAICLFSTLVPWKVVFALQKVIAPAPVTARGIAVHFDPAHGHFQSAAQASSARIPPISGAGERDETNEDAILHIPLVFTGIPTGSILKVDRTVARLTGPSTTREQIVSAMGDPGDFEVPDDDQHTSEPRPVDEILHVRGSVYTRLKDAPVTLQLDYSVTLLNLSSTHSIPAVNGDLRIDGLGRCETRLNDSRTEVDLIRVNIGNPSQCTTALLQDPDTGLHNPPLHDCRDDYAPYFGRYQPPDTLVLRGVDFDFRDPSGLIHYPVNESTVNGAHVLIN